METIFAMIKEFIDFYMSTDLPAETLNRLVDIWEYVSEVLTVLMRDYISVFFA